MDTSVAVALIAAVGGVIVALVQRSRKENKDDHAIVQKRLDTVIDMVAKQGSRMTSHLDWHLDKKPAEDPKK